MNPQAPTTESSPHLSIVLACLNEEGHLEANVRAIDEVLAQTHWTSELIFVDDGSQDGTRSLIERLCDGHPGRRYFFHERNVGRGGTVSEGIRAAQGTYVGFIDVDLEVHARYIPSFVLELEHGRDVVCGYRVYRLSPSPVSLVRHLISVTYRSLTRLSLALPLHDTEAGIKFFRRSRILPVLDACQDQRWFWDTEVVARSVDAGLDVMEVPVVFVRRADKQSTVRIVRDSVRQLKALARFLRQNRARPA